MCVKNKMSGMLANATAGKRPGFGGTKLADGSTPPMGAPPTAGASFTAPIGPSGEGSGDDSLRIKGKNFASTKSGLAIKGMK